MTDKELTDKQLKIAVRYADQFYEFVRDLLDTQAITIKEQKELYIRAVLLCGCVDGTFPQPEDIPDHSDTD